jgi:thymidylate synthase (FAD)
MKVELIAHTPNPAAIVEEAASVCYDSKPTKSHAIAKSCLKSGHLSVWEHVSFTFHVSEVSRALLAQLTRHRHLSFSVRSQRYCREDGFKYVNPFPDGDIREMHFRNAMEFDEAVYNDLIECGAAPEDARAILPNACYTELYVTGNARALIEASHLRLCVRAQKEIRHLFKSMKELIEPVCPEVAAAMVPTCETHDIPYCSEHHNGCGRYPKLKELIKEKA